MRSGLVGLLVSGMVAACGGGGITGDGPPIGSVAPGSPVVGGPITPRVGISNFDDLVEANAVANHATQRGFDCGWHVGWQKQVLLARRDDAAAFRTRTMAGATGLGFVTFLIGAAAIIAAATLYPRLRRARQLTDQATPTTPATTITTANDKAMRPWLRLLTELGRNGVRRLVRWLHLEQFDPLRADRWGEALGTAFEAERQLRCAAVSARALPGHDGDAGKELIERVETWRSELKRFRMAWEEEPLPPGQVAPEHLLPTLSLALRCARDLRHALARAQARGDAPEWQTWLSDVRGRPATPDLAAPSGPPVAPWVRRVGWLGLGAVALGMFLTAGWFAAGALPLVPAAFLSLTGLAAVVVARLHLRQAGGFRLLPGFADRAARWLVGMSALTTTLMLVSAWMSAPSGLDLGDPPPIAMPDADAMKPPTIDTARVRRAGP
jgi:hypothetical protein